jgi:ABC-2 type transport system permease protein
MSGARGGGPMSGGPDGADRAAVADGGLGMTSETWRPTRPWWWSVRRELWENHLLVRAPLAVAALVLVGFLIDTLAVPGRLRVALHRDPEGAWQVLARPYAYAAIPLVLVGVLVAAFYCLDALYGERRDRSLRFWRSLPVTDTQAVLAKLAIPLLVLPGWTLALALAVQLVLLVVGTVVLTVTGFGPGILWVDVPFLAEWGMLVYGLVALALWHAPVYAWLLYVSSWAPRLPLLWAVVPPLALGLVEKAAFGSEGVCYLLQDRLVGVLHRGFDFAPGALTAAPFSQVTPGELLSAPALWIGWLVAVLLVAATIRRRRRAGSLGDL